MALLESKVGSIYWGEIAQGSIQILPIGDTTWTLTCMKYVHQN